MKRARTEATPSQTPTQMATFITDQEQIRRRAFEIYEQPGRSDGHELDDWLHAESEVTQQKAKKAAA